MTRLRIAVVGAGSMGALHARSIASSDRAQLTHVVDIDRGRASDVAARHGAVGLGPSGDIDADAVVIAAPTTLHVDLATDLLARGIPVLVEKPLAPDSAGVRRIITAARSTDTPVMCGFVERFNPVVVTAAEMIDEPFVHWVSVRHSPPAGRPTSHVATDLLIHDVDLALRMHGTNPIELLPDLDGFRLPTVTGAVGRPGDPLSGEVADCTIVMDDGAVATMSASRIGQRKVREVRVMTAGALYELDLLRHDITIYRHVHHGPGLRDASYRSETVIEVPFVRAHQEPLASQLDHFIDLARGDADPLAEIAGMWMPHQLMDELCGPMPQPELEVVP